MKRRLRSHQTFAVIFRPTLPLLKDEADYQIYLICNSESEDKKTAVNQQERTSAGI
jgi:hypothetical protein